MLPATVKLPNSVKSGSTYEKIGGATDGIINREPLPQWVYVPITRLEPTTYYTCGSASEFDTLTQING